MLSQAERDNEGRKLTKLIADILKMKNPGRVKKASITMEVNEPIVIELTSQV